MTPEEQILICAVRYALGRMSYIVGTVCDYVKSKSNEISENCKNIIIKDIEESVEYYHAIGCRVGMEFDERDWINLLNVLKEMNCANGN